MKNRGGNIAILCFSAAHLWVLTPSIEKPPKVSLKGAPTFQIWDNLNNNKISEVMASDS